MSFHFCVFFTFMAKIENSISKKQDFKKLEAIERFYMDLNKILGRVVIYHAQYKHLIQLCLIRTYPRVSVDQMRRLYKLKKLRQLSILLDTLIHMPLHPTHFYCICTYEP